MLVTVLLVLLALLGDRWVAAWPSSVVFAGFLFSRFDPGTAPYHPARALILGLVRARPGIGARELALEAGLNYSVLRHHVQVLETVGLLQSLRGPDAKHLYDRGASLPEARRRLVFEQDRLVGFLHKRAQGEFLLRREACQALRRRFGVSRVGAWKAVRRALAVGALVAEATPTGERLAAGGAANRPAYGGSP